MQLSSFSTTPTQDRSYINFMEDIFTLSATGRCDDLCKLVVDLSTEVAAEKGLDFILKKCDLLRASRSLATSASEHIMGNLKWYVEEDFARHVRDGCVRLWGHLEGLQRSSLRSMHAQFSQVRVDMTPLLIPDDVSVDNEAFLERMSLSQANQLKASLEAITKIVELHGVFKQSMIKVNGADSDIVASMQDWDGESFMLIAKHQAVRWGVASLLAKRNIMAKDKGTELRAKVFSVYNNLYAEGKELRAFFSAELSKGIAALREVEQERFGK